MARDTFTFKVDGSVELQDFTGALHLLTDFVKTLAIDIAKGTNIRWIIDDLKAGSAMAVLRGEASEEEDVARVVRGIAVVGDALVTGKVLPYSDRVRNAAVALTHAIQGSVTALHLQTDEIDAVLTTPIQDEEERILRTHALGSLEGMVETLQRRDGYSFTLYDALLDRAVRCHGQADQEDVIRAAWGNRVRVTGKIGRDPLTGRALDIHAIWRIDILPEVEPGTYKTGLGMLETDDKTPPEILIRRVRDAE